MNQPLLSLENENYFFTTDKTELALNTEEFKQLYSIQKLNFNGFSGIARVTRRVLLYKTVYRGYFTNFHNSE